MKLALLIVGIILFLFAAVVHLVRYPSVPAWSHGFTALGLAFFAASFAVPT